MQDDGSSESSSVAPGAITALLREVFRAPQRPGGGISAFRPGLVVGRFELVRMLGRGGFGVVFEAVDRTLGRAVAFKAVRAVGDVDGNAEMLLREAEAAAQLSHPNIVVLYDVGTCDDGPYLVMELLRGRTLADRLLDGALPVEDALHVGQEVARGVAHAHARRVVHRDLKPGNVFLCDDGQVKVLDFGMARIFGRPKVDGGTVAYMAPEQRRGEPEDERTDVFALGVMLHEMLTGTRPPADAGTAADGEPASSAAPPAGAASLPALVARMRAPHPDARPRNGDEVLVALRRAEREWRTPPAGAGSRHPVLAWAAAILGGAAVAAGLAIVLARAAQSPPPPLAPAPASVPVTLAAARPGPLPVLARADPAAAPAPRAGSAPAALPTPGRAPARHASASSTRAASAPAPAPTPAPTVRFCRASVDSIATPRPESGDGVLVVVADPFGDIFVDGQAYGETPSECLVAAGTHVVRTVHSRYGTREDRVEVHAGQRTRFAADFLAAP